jgi:hypothetical protein
MRKIFKYQIDVVHRQECFMPTGAKILSVQCQRGMLCLWAEVDPAEPPSPRIIQVVGTGHEFKESDKLAFIGTAQMAGGDLVWHVFEER